MEGIGGLFAIIGFLFVAIKVLSWVGSQAKDIEEHSQNRKRLAAIEERSKTYHNMERRIAKLNNLTDEDEFREIKFDVWRLPENEELEYSWSQVYDAYVYSGEIAALKIAEEVLLKGVPKLLEKPEYLEEMRERKRRDDLRRTYDGNMWELQRWYCPLISDREMRKIVERLGYDYQYSDSDSAKYQVKDWDDFENRLKDALANPDSLNK